MVIFLIYIILLLICIIFPKMTIVTTKETIKLWTETIVPSLLPFFIISKCIYLSGGVTFFIKILKPITNFLGLPDSIAFPLSMSLLCGYQTGSRTVANMNLKNNIDTFANVCFSASPIYTIGTVGTLLLNNTFSGYALYTIHVCTLLIITVFFSNTNIEVFWKEPEKEPLSVAINESISAILSICGYMILYNLIIKITTYIFSPETSIIISGFWEFTQGIKQSSLLYTDPLPIISFFLSFGGMCVISQCLSILKGASKIKFIFYRLLSGFIAYVLCIIYKKTALYIPITITLIIIVSAHILRRRKYYWLKSAKSSEI